jgi:hypothetical protein
MWIQKQIYQTVDSEQKWGGNKTDRIDTHISKLVRINNDNTLE